MRYFSFLCCDFRSESENHSMNKIYSTLLPCILSVTKPRPERDEGGRQNSSLTRHWFSFKRHIQRAIVRKEATNALQESRPHRPEGFCCGPGLRQLWRDR